MITNKLFDLQEKARITKKEADELEKTLLEKYCQAFTKITGKKPEADRLSIYKFAPGWAEPGIRDCTGLNIVEIWFWDPPDEANCSTVHNVTYVVAEHFDSGKFDIDDCTLDNNTGYLVP
jgi:hypothetical protein